MASCCDVGVTLTLTWLSRRDAPPDPEPPAPKPNVRKLRCFCWKASECGCNNCKLELLCATFSLDDEFRGW